MRRLPLIVITLGIILLAVYIGKKAGEQKPVAQNPPPKLEQKPDPVKPPSPPIVKPKTYEEALASISEGEIRQHLEYLCSQELEGRMSGKKGNILAAEYIKKIYESYGLQTTYQKFPISRMNPGPKNETGDDFTQNVIAWMDGQSDEIVVIGAHMDHIGYGPKMSQWGGGKIHPGADDNGSGTVALLQIAKACASLKGQNKRTIVFMSFSGEEMGLIGSRYYVENPMFPKSGPSLKKHVFMFNMDMVGRLGDRGEYSATFQETADVVDLDKIISGLNAKYPFARKITGRGSGGSDHASFYNKKIPVVCVHTGMHSDYHTPSDVTSKINFNGVEKVAKYGFEFCWQVSQADTRPTFNYGGFQPMTYTHDHEKRKFNDE
jgi:hypothetical protein